MSVFISAAVWQHSRAKATGLLVLLSLADQAHDDGWCWPSVDSIAQRCRISGRTAQRFLAELELLGEIEREERPGTSNRYRVLLGGDNMTPRQSVTGDSGVTGGVTTVSPRNVTEPKEELSLRSSSLPAQDAQAKTKRGTRLDPSWLPDPELIAEMRAECPTVDLQAEHRKFVDYWTAKTGRDATKLDWRRTWRNWIRNAKPANGRRPSRQEETDQNFARLFAHAQEKDQQSQPKEELTT